MCKDSIFRLTHTGGRKKDKPRKGVAAMMAAVMLLTLPLAACGTKGEPRPFTDKEIERFRDEQERRKQQEEIDRMTRIPPVPDRNRTRSPR